MQGLPVRFFLEDFRVCVVWTTFTCVLCIAWSAWQEGLGLQPYAFIYTSVVYFEVYIFEKNGGEIGMILAYLDDNRAAP